MYIHAHFAIEVCTECDDIVAMCMHAFACAVACAQCDDIRSSDSVQPKIAKPKRGGGVGRRQLDIYMYKFD